MIMGITGTNRTDQNFPISHYGESPSGQTTDHPSGGIHPSCRLFGVSAPPGWEGSTATLKRCAPSAFKTIPRATRSLHAVPTVRRRESPALYLDMIGSCWNATL